MNRISTLNEKTVSAVLINGRLEVIRREPTKFGEIYSDNPPPFPDQVWKDIYEVVEGKIALTKTIKGKHAPAYKVAEKISFD